MNMERPDDHVFMKAGSGFFFKTSMRFAMIKATLTENEENLNAIFGFQECGNTLCGF
jgi:hypothetical protein